MHHHHKTIQPKNILIIYEDPTLLTTDSIDPNGLTLLLGLEGGMNLSFLLRNSAVDSVSYTHLRAHETDS